MFEYFLIDMQMEPEVLTSRIVQAISTVQLFVQRCYLGLEERYGVPAGRLIGQDQWDKWMKRYRIWEANRKVFLYPENWIQPSLRDDKSPFFKELESELLQRDVSPQTIGDAIKNYTFKLHEISDLHCEGIFVEPSPEVLHVFARTRNAPYLHFYANYQVNDAVWSAWEKVNVDIPSYDSEKQNINRSVNELSGTYLTPVVWGQRLLLFFPQFVKKSAPNPGFQTEKPYKEIGEKSSPNDSKPIEYWEIKLAWSERKNGRWTPKQISTDAIVQEDLPRTLPHLSSFRFVPRLFSDKLIFDIDTNKDQLWGTSARRRNIRMLQGNPSITTETSPLFAGMSVEGPGIESGTSIQAVDHSTSTVVLSKPPAVPPRIHNVSCDEHFITILGVRIRWPRRFDVNCDSNFIDADELKFSVSSVHSKTPGFQFDGTHVFASGSLSDLSAIPNSRFHVSREPTDPADCVRSLQTEGANAPSYLNLPIVTVVGKEQKLYSRNSGLASPECEMRHDFAYELAGKTNGESLQPLISCFRDRSDDNPNEAFGGNGKRDWNELRKPFSIYNWEFGFHIPMFLSERCLNAQQYDRALEMAHSVFDPKKGTTASPTDVWQFFPFRDSASINTLEHIMNGIASGDMDEIEKVSRWRDRPFEPHLIARDRPSAYMKWTVMQYLRILIAYGDHYFRMNTLEFIPMAVQCYVMASHLYGDPGQMIPRRGKKKIAKYNDLVNRLDAFGNAFQAVELLFPASNQVPVPIDDSELDVALPNLLGFLRTRYFCIPNNPMLRGLKETIDDRLFKIRHSLDINGVFRQLPLFEPPIDPALLVQATAQGLNLNSVLNDLGSPLPNYRFVYLHQKALELCSEVKSLGNAFLSTKEKRDSESLARLRANHESVIQDLILETRKLQLAESQKSLDALQESRKGPESRMQYYLRLIGEDLGKLPNADADFSEIPNNVEQPVSESGLKLIRYEKEQLDKAKDSAETQVKAGAVEELANVLSLIPQFGIDAMFWGIGGDVKFGGQQLGPATSAIARIMKIAADYLAYQSSSAATKGGFLRALQDRIQQANQAGYEIKNIDRQILAQRIRVNIAEQELKNHEKQIEHAREVNDFLRNKYTNDDLYSYMEGSLRTLFYQTYTLAYDLAKKAERAFQFERVKPTLPGNQTQPSFIQLGYWDAGHDGLMSGEKLYLALKAVRICLPVRTRHDFEITKQVSLRQLNPAQLVELRTKGICSIELPESLFDMDFPGHFMRRIKSVALTVPCVVGPYTGLNCTLKLESNEIRKQGISSGPYAKKLDEDDERFMTCHVPISSIAVSTGQNDSGVFELNFRDERYIPFEGAGAISKWSLRLPEIRQFDYETIADVVMTIRYTSIDGGEVLKTAATDAVKDALKSIEDQASSVASRSLSILSTTLHHSGQDFRILQQMGRSPRWIVRLERPSPAHCKELE